MLHVLKLLQTSADTDASDFKTRKAIDVISPSNCTHTIAQQEQKIKHPPPEATCPVWTTFTLPDVTMHQLLCSTNQKGMQALRCQRLAPPLILETQDFPPPKLKSKALKGTGNLTSNSK